jgi:hypothetical protein
MVIVHFIVKLSLYKYLLQVKVTTPHMCLISIVSIVLNRNFEPCERP